MGRGTWNGFGLGRVLNLITLLFNPTRPAPDPTRTGWPRHVGDPNNILLEEIKEGSKDNKDNRDNKEEGIEE